MPAHLELCIYLPARPVRGTQESELTLEIPRGAGERILFVDDEPALGDVAQKMMQRLGYRAVVFQSPEAALAAFCNESTAYDALVTDLTMPGMTGIELARQVLALHPGFPIILASHPLISAVLNGYYRYYAVPTNSKALAAFYNAVRTIWHRSLQRRSQKGRWTVAMRQTFEQRFPLPLPRILHPWPTERFALRRPEVGARCGKSARRVMSGGRPERAVPTRNSALACGRGARAE